MMIQEFNFWILEYSFKKAGIQKPLLAYWNIRGLSAALRYQLVYQGVDFDMKRYLPEGGPSWPNEKWLLGMDFPNLPYFIDGDFKLSETNAIHEYIAQKWNPELLGTTT
jgi:glutathione S-transferase